MKNLLHALISLFICATLSADEYFCEPSLDNSNIGIKKVIFDTQSTIVTIVLFNDWSHTGKVTSRKKHNDGIKYNFYFNNTGIAPGFDSEYILFPWKDRYRIIGVQYFTDNGKRLLHSGEGNYAVDCEIEKI